MSSILDQIDDTLDDWHGSSDAMRWRPDEARVRPMGPMTISVAAPGTDPRDTAAFTTLEVESVRWDPQLSVRMTASVEGFVTAMQRLQASAAVASVNVSNLKAALLLLAAPSPSALDARYHRRYRNRQGRR